MIDGENLVYGLRHLLGIDGEKAVDIGLAVRILTEANPNTEIVVVSADTDLLPAFTAAKKLGAKLMHVGYEFRAVHALSRIADISRTITLPLAQKYKKNTKL